jgi:hypothetical protein
MHNNKWRGVIDPISPLGQNKEENSGPIRKSLNSCARAQAPAARGRSASTLSTETSDGKMPSSRRRTAISMLNCPACGSSSTRPFRSRKTLKK